MQAYVCMHVAMSDSPATFPTVIIIPPSFIQISPAIHVNQFIHLNNRRRMKKKKILE
jgi:hypothetical protein